MAPPDSGPAGDHRYHVVGPRPRFDDLADDVDIYATDAPTFWSKLRAGDDFVQWTLRYGCILFDRTGIFCEGLGVIEAEGIWPDPSRKLERLPAHRRHAERLIALGDRDAAQEQMRAALTSAARAVLLAAGVFPLARRELSDQLLTIGRPRLSGALRASIRERVGLGRLQVDLEILDEVIADTRLCGGGERSASVANERPGARALARGLRA